MHPPLVGREHELARATELLLQASSLIVEGEAGVGKTRLLHAIAERVRASGWQVEHIAGSVAAASVPFGAVVHLLSIAPTSDRLQLLQQAQRALTSRAARQRLLIVADDAPLLDDGSAALVHRVAAVDGLLVLASARSGEPLNPSVRRCGRMGSRSASSYSRWGSHKPVSSSTRCSGGRVRRSSTDRCRGSHGVTR
jgi:hypothetical protein